MIALLLIALAAATEHATEDLSAGAPTPNASIPNVDLDGLFTYGLGNGSALGGDSHLTLSFPVWRTTRALGTIEVGVKGTYQNEPLALQPWAEGPTTGTTHRIGFAATVGHSFRFGAQDRISFGFHVYGGGVHWISNYDVRYDVGGVRGPGYINATVPDVGAMVRFTYRPHPVVGLSVQIAAPFFGLSPDTVVGLFTVGAGLTFRLN